MPTLPLYPLLGMDERYRAPATTAAKIENMRWSERGAWHKAHGYTQLKDTQNESATSVPIGTMVLHETDQGGRRWLVYERKESDAAGAKLVYLDLSSNTETVIESGRHWSDGPWIGTQYVAIGEILYYVNGVDRPGRWNTLRSAEPGFSTPPGAPIVMDYDQNPDDGGANKDDQIFDRMSTSSDVSIGKYYQSFGGKYGKGVGQRSPDSSSAVSVTSLPLATFAYGVTYVNELGQESPLSRLVFGRAQTSDQWGRRSIALALRSPPENAVSVRIWRSMNLTPSAYVPVATGASTAEMLRYMPERPSLPAFAELQEQEVYLLFELPASGPLLITDMKGDEHLGQRYDHAATGLWPQGARLIAWFAGRVWLAGTPANPGRLFYSHHLYREQFPEDNRFDLPREITALYSTGEELFVFTGRSVHLVFQDDAGALRMRTLTESQGTNSPNAIRHVPGSGVWFLNQTGIYRLTAGEPERVSHAVQKTWDERVTPRLEGAWALLDARDKEYWVHVPADGQARPWLGVVYHYEIGQWSLRPGWGAAAAVQAPDPTMTTFLAGWDTANSRNGVLVYGPGYDDWNGTAFDGVYTAAWQAFGDIRERVHVTSVEVEALGYTGRALTVEWRADRGRTWLTPDTTISPDHIELYSEVAVWGSGDRQATFGTTTWKDLEPTVTRVDTFGSNAMGFGITARELQVRVTASGKVGLISLGLIYNEANGLRIVAPAQGSQ